MAVTILDDVERANGRRNAQAMKRNLWLGQWLDSHLYDELFKRYARRLSQAGVE